MTCAWMKTTRVSSNSCIPTFFLKTIVFVHAHFQSQIECISLNIHNLDIQPVHNNISDFDTKVDKHSRSTIYCGMKLVKQTTKLHLLILPFAVMITYKMQSCITSICFSIKSPAYVLGYLLSRHKGLACVGQSLLFSHERITI
jgi:hypothetical protein